MTDITQKWSDKATLLLAGRKIERVRYLTEKEREGLGWSKRSLVLILDDGTYLWPSADDEGNNAGSFFTTNSDLMTIPTIP
jgi:hypothetical protein